MNATLNARPNLMAVLEDQGYRTTVPRRTVIDLIERKQEGFTAEEICEEIPTVGRATVYRTIKLLLKAGVICKITTMDGGPKYSLSRIEHHHHTVCTGCGTVGEFRAATVERLLRAVGDDIPGEIIGHRMEFYVLCDRCLSDVSA